MRRVYTAAIATLALLGAVEAQAGDYTRTRYPIVLVHGVTGFNTIGGLVNYFHTIPWNLERDGARVYVASVAAFNDSEQRGAELARQIVPWAAAGGGKVNLIGHSQGSPTSRVAASLRPDLVVVNREENRELDVRRMRERGLTVEVTDIETVPQGVCELERLLD